MPRRTPVKELQKEEPVVSSPLRRSTRLNTSSPVPTKVITRRSSASEAAPPASTPKATRGRRSSFNQETEIAAETKRPTSTVRTRRSSVTKTNEEPIQEEPAPKPKTRGSSVPTDQPKEVKTTTRRRRSVADDSEPEDEQTKKLTRSRSGSITKKTENDDTKVKKQSTPGTPVRKVVASKEDKSMESAEDIKEIDENVTGSNSRRRNTEVAKVDLDLSVINEASITEEELTPEKKKKNFEEKKEDKSVESLIKDQQVTEQAEKIKPKENEIEIQEPKPNGSTAPKKTNNTLEIIQEKEVVHQNGTVDNSDNKSEDSFTLELSYGGAENEAKENGSLNVCDKENISLEKPQEECEPMDVDNSVVESPVKKLTSQTGKLSVILQKIDIEKTIKMAEKVHDEITEFLSEDVSPLKEKKSNIKSNTESVVAASLIQQNKLQPFVRLQRENFETSSEQVKNIEKSDKTESLEISKNIEEHKAKITEEKSELIINDFDVIDETKDLPESEDIPLKKTNEISKSNLNEKISLVDEDCQETEKHSVEFSEENLNDQSDANQLTKDTESSPEPNDSDFVEQQETVSPTKKDAGTTLKKKVVSNVVDVVEATEVEKDKIYSKHEDLINSESDESDKVEENKNSEDITLDKSVIEKQTDSEFQEQVNESCILEEKETLTTNSIIEKKSMPPFQKKINESDVAIDESTVIEEKIVKNDKKKLSLTSIAIDSPVFISDETSSEMEVDLEVQTTNSNKDSTHVDEISTLLSEDISVTETTDPEEFLEDEKPTCKSPTKKVRSHISISDDEVFTTRKDKNAKSKTSNVFDRSIDSPYLAKLYQTEPKLEKSNSNSKSNEVFEVSDDEAVEEGTDVDKSNNPNNIKNESDNEITKIADGKQNETVTEEIDSSLLSNSSRKHSERTSITLQETIKAGEDEHRLSGRIYKVVDLFCAGIKNNADVSINVSLEYTCQDSEDENTTDVVEIALTAEEIKNAEQPKGSKRRKICHTPDTELKSPKTDSIRVEENQANDINVITSTKDTTEEKVSSAQKKKRKSGNLLLKPDTDISKSSPKVSFSTDLEDDDRSDKLNKSELSISYDEQKNSGADKKTLPLTPYKSSNDKQNTGEGNSSDEMNEEEAEQEEDENDGENVSSESENSEIFDLLSKSFNESDANDTTWKSDEQTSDEIDSDVVIEEEDDETEVINNLSLIESPLPPRKTNSKSFTSSTNTDEGKDDVSVEDLLEKEQRKRPASRIEQDMNSKNLSPGKKRKLFRLSRYDVQQALETSDSDENLDKKTNKLKSHKNVDSKNSKYKKTVKSTFVTKSVGKILPQRSEVKENRKRTRGPIKDDSQLQTKGSKHARGDSNEEGNYNVIKPSGGKLKNVKPLNIKPSTKSTSDWQVSSLS